MPVRGSTQNKNVHPLEPGAHSFVVDRRDGSYAVRSIADGAGGGRTDLRRGRNRDRLGDIAEPGGQIRSGARNRSDALPGEDVGHNPSVSDASGISRKQIPDRSLAEA